MNRNKVLDKIPDETKLDANEHISECLTELLRENFGSNTKRVLIRRKRQRLGVVPGKSVGTFEAKTEQESERVEEVTQSNEEVNVVENGIKEVECVSPEIELLLPGTYVLVKFLSGRKRKSTLFKYVCKIKEKFSDNELTVIGLKAANDGVTKFKHVDKDTVPISDIITILPEPQMEENEYYFRSRVDVFEL